jgi:hypothetical protein
MSPLSQHPRSPSSPSPIYGIRPGFTVGDLDRAYTPSIPVFGTPVTYPAGTATTGGLQPNWDPGSVVPFSTTISSGPTVVQPNARAVKIAVNVSGTGSITLIVKSNVDAYATVVATYNNITAGGYQFYLGGFGTPAEFSSPTNEPQTDDPSNVSDPNVAITQSGVNTTLYPTSDATSYIGGLVQYGPVGAISEVTSGASQNTGGFDPGRRNAAGLNPSTDNNFFGQTYNPFQFLSLDGYALQFTATVTGTVGYDVEVMPIS